LLTVGGIAWIVSERQPAREASVESERQYAPDVLLGLVARWASPWDWS
jgi:hypothetical protein